MIGKKAGSDSRISPYLQSAEGLLAAYAYMLEDMYRRIWEKWLALFHVDAAGFRAVPICRKMLEISIKTDELQTLSESASVSRLKTGTGL
ncbi:hypothetical protein GCM10010918_21320 [Paenibacillus radicis (ex Gao et al. 2016)]|uniref:Uncharacterized protein n=1 Tax=Paenibacillus radicis (ex Gao et al. 2016) TaxID=1737354 RepID=A0A917H3N5_9BACL|nr:hypothetical protein GCM10010918_21320 [Paenibacillus radicis (ex Gao et al. 2016)]